MTYSYRTHGTCSSEIIVDLEDDVVRSVRIIGGCSGNLQGISSLIQGMKTEEVIARLKGIRCGTKPTSCPDQIAAALEKARVLQEKA